MFTGLVEKIGTVKRVSRGRGLVIEFAFDPWMEPLVPGESVAVNGTCLTVARCDSTRFTADVLRETEQRTGLATAPQIQEHATLQDRKEAAMQNPVIVEAVRTFNGIVADVHLPNEKEDA